MSTPIDAWDDAEDVDWFYVGRRRMARRKSVTFVATGGALNPVFTEGEIHEQRLGAWVLSQRVLGPYLRRARTPE